MFHRLGTDFAALPEDFPTMLPWMTAAVWKCSGPAHHPSSVSRDSVRRNLAGVRMEQSLKLHILLLQLQRPALLCLPSPSHASLFPVVHRGETLALALHVCCTVETTLLSRSCCCCAIYNESNPKTWEALACLCFDALAFPSATQSRVKITAGQRKRMHLRVQITRILSALAMSKQRKICCLANRYLLRLTSKCSQCFCSSAPIVCLYKWNLIWWVFASTESQDYF